MLENTMPERTSVCASKRRRYNLAEPKPCVRQQYVLTPKNALLHNNNVMKELIFFLKANKRVLLKK